MPRFPFSISGRKKKTASHPPDAEPLSKTPCTHEAMAMNPQEVAEAASSPTLSDNRSSTTTMSSSYYGSEARDMDDMHPVVIAGSENGWGEHLEDATHHRQPLAGTVSVDGSEDRKSLASSFLRKSGSSLTIKSWYDKTKLPLSISQQTSSSAMAIGLPPKAASAGMGNMKSRAAKKPATLALTGFLLDRRQSKRASSAQQEVDDDGVESGMTSPSLPSPAANVAHARPKRHTDEKFCQEAAAEGVRPATGGSDRSPRNTALSELPTLYNRYEKVSIEAVMGPDSLPVVPCQDKTGNGLKARSRSCRESKTYRPFPQCSAPTTPQTARFASSSSPPIEAISTSSRYARKPKASKKTNCVLEFADLNRTSVLMLSSDSEAEYSCVASPAATANTTRSVTKKSSAQRSKCDDDIPPHRPPRPSTSQGVRTGEGHSGQAVKSNKHASFAPSSMYPLPDGSEGANATSRYGFQATSSPSSRRASLMSNFSVNSTLTWQTKSDHGLQETRAGNAVNARRLSDIGPAQARLPLARGMNFDHGVFQRASSARVADQLTPPLSPTSVGLYLHSAPSPADGHGGHSRIVAITRQEEMLLAAIRKKQQSFRSRILANLEEYNADEEGEKQTRHGREESRPHKRRSRSLRFKTTQATTTGSTIDFCFPVPPTTNNESSSSIDEASLKHHPPARRPSKHRRSSRRHSSIEVARRDDTSVRDTAGTMNLHPPTGSRLFEKAIQLSPYEVPVYDMEPKPDLEDIWDWDAALSPVSDHAKDSASRDAGAGAHCCSLPSPSTSLRCAGNFPSCCEVLGEPVPAAEEQDVPRPDSPISPMFFFDDPGNRVVLSKTAARLSAVGPPLFDSGIAGAEEEV
ncbi:hypothetical protein RJ55_00780 [Drechmeria coniospora]|nr:hypothetical protein RJ55_00780 [Drechmeria coniospora]